MKDEGKLPKENPSSILQPSAFSLHPFPTVAADLACRRCGYNLRTLRADANCPECALPVAASAHGDALLYSDPSWLAKVTLGADLLVGGWLAVLPTVLSVFIFLPAFAVLTTATVASILTGTWLLTRPDPSGCGEPAYGRSRKLARFLPLANLAVPFLAELRDAHTSTGSTPDLVSVLLTASIFAGRLASLGALLAMLSFLQSLAARRLPDADLAKRCVTISAHLSGSGIVCLALSVLGGFLTAPAWRSGHATVTALASLYLLVSLARFVGVLILFRGKLHRQLDLARQAWSAATKGVVS
jgi:hypothetical protein